MAKEAAAGIVTAQKPPAGKGLEGALQELISNVPAVKRVLVQARERGFVTHDEINAALPEDEISPDVVDELIAMFEEMGVSVGGGEANGAAAKGDLERDEDDESDGSAGYDEDLGRTDDPVRMYLREMGTIELLSREGEIEIAKRIEAGRNTVLEALCEIPLTMRAIISWRNAIGAGKVLLRDVIDLEATYGAEPQSDGEEAETDDKAEAEAGEAASEAAEEVEDEEDDFDEGALSLSAMEASVKEGVLATFDRIAETYERVRALQEKRLAAVRRNEATDPKLDASYEKARTEVVELVNQVHLNPNRGEGLVEQLYKVNRRLNGSSGWRPSESGAGTDLPSTTPPRSRRSARTSPRSRAARACTSASSAASSGWCKRASARPVAPRRRWSRPTSAWSSRSPRST